MTLPIRVTGSALIAGEFQSGTSDAFQAINAATGEHLQEKFPENGLPEIRQAAAAAQRAFSSYRALSDLQRSQFIEQIASELESLKDAIVARGTLETGLPEGRLQGELGRTTGQLRSFANLLKEGSWVRAVIETAQPDRAPLPKPDVRSFSIPLGPVAIFGASNFPLAFSVLGGDTASALAAGCPVIFKGHPAHPGTSELAARAVANAITACELDAGVFSLLQGTTHTLGSELVKHPDIKAVGFTGSLGAGRALFDQAQQRPEPIPFFGELGSTNPVFILPETLAESADKIATGFVGSLSLFAGQFCTTPGLAIVCEDDSLQTFVDVCQATVAKVPPQVMLTSGILGNYNQGVARLESHSTVKTISEGLTEENRATTKLCRVKASDWLANPLLEEEIFGPSSLLVVCQNKNEMLDVAKRLAGHLTATIHCKNDDVEFAGTLAQELELHVGRILFNGYPTGVEVCAAMHHGGPWPASTDSRSTSVGTRAIERFTRPVCYQDMPDALLPDALKNANALELSRLVDGQITQSALGHAVQGD